MQQRPNLCMLNSQEGEGDRGCEGHTDNLLITLVCKTLSLNKESWFLYLLQFFFLHLNTEALGRLYFSRSVDAEF